MSYSIYSPIYISVTGLAVIAGTPVDIATGFLPTSSRFYMDNVAMSMVAGTGIGTTATFTFNTGSAGIGPAITGATLAPTTLNTSSGLALFQPFFPISYLSGNQIVVRQTAAASAAGVVGFQLRIAPLF